MRRKSIIILALVLVFALMFTACAARRPLQTPVQPRQDTTGLYDNNRGVGSGAGRTTGVGTRTGVGTGGYTGRGPSSNDPYDLGYGAGNNAGYGGYGATGIGRDFGGTGTTGNYGGLGTGMGNPTYYGGYGGYGGYNNGMYGGYGNDYRNIGGGNNSPNFALNNNRGTTQADSIARAVEQMTGVDNATCVVSGNTAYVGIDTDGDLTGRNIAYGNATDLTAVKRACAQRVKSVNPNIQTVYVSTDANFFDRLRNVGDRVRNGGNVNNFRNELNTLIRGLTPERQ
ncbi:MAG TPA: YhcN/YlaJ family sporulation lipoprotein [Clostridia bacterium]|nr:YhcN/YlaJ family sporulation lipoprotein [Clostridia bacterium]